MEESGSETPVATDSNEKDRVPGVSKPDKRTDPQDEEVTPARRETKGERDQDERVSNEREEKETIFQVAAKHVDAVAQKLGDEYDAYKLIAREVLWQIASATSAEAALRNLEHLLSIMEELVAELDAKIQPPGFGETEETGVSIDLGQTGASQVIFQSEQENGDSDDSRLVDTLSDKTDQVKQGLLDYVSTLFPNQFLDKASEG